MADRHSIHGLMAEFALPEEVVAAVKTTLGRFDRIDVLINNAGVNVFSEPCRNRRIFSGLRAMNF